MNGTVIRSQPVSLKSCECVTNLMTVTRLIMVSLLFSRVLWMSDYVYICMLTDLTLDHIQTVYILVGPNYVYF